MTRFPFNLCVPNLSAAVAAMFFRPKGPCVNSQGRPTGAPGSVIPKADSPKGAIVKRNITIAPVGLDQKFKFLSRGSLWSPLAINACPFGAFQMQINATSGLACSAGILVEH